MAEEFPPFRYVAPVDPNIGRRVDSYFVLRSLLGRGGMGAAYLAEHEARAHVKCVVKLVLPELARNPMVISRYRTETEAVSVLKHENIVKLHNFGVLDDGQMFMRFEFVEGKSLDSYVAERGGLLSLREAAYFVFQLCDALDYAHSCQVIHRDLKPDNLMVEVSPRGSHLTERIKILDFGIAKVESTTERTGAGVQMGTPRFMPPEQVTNAASVTGYADVFAMTTIFYLMVTGQLPWGTPESDIAIYHKQKTEPPDRPSEDVMPRAVAALVLRGLSLVPEDRPTMREFAIELAGAIAAEDGLPSGAEILKDVKRDWVTPSLAHAQPRPRPVEAPNAAARDANAPSPDAAGSARDLTITANARPRPGAASLAPSNPDPPSQSRRRRPPTPSIATMNTGFVSRRYTIRESPVGPRDPSIVAASEIETAVGTPGPQPYAHAELPAVVVSTTQLSSVTSQTGAPAARPPGPPEPPPVLVLPEFARPRAHRKLVIGVVLAMVAAIVGVAVRQRASQVATSTGNDAAGSARASEPAPSGFAAPVDASAVAADARLSVAAPPPRMVDAGQPDADTAAGTVKSATKPEPTRVAAPRPPPAPKLLLRDRQREARTSGAKTGNLHLLVTPWAVCWVDGERIDQTPCMLDGLPVGRYRVRLENSVAHKDEILTAAVTAGETTTIEKTW
jgi:serine/threonine-protein kinase